VSCADGAPVRPRSKCWREAELSACCAAAAASSSTFNCWHTRRSSEVVASGQSRSNMDAVVRFCNARLKSGGASASVLALASKLVPSSRVRPQAGGVGVRAHGCWTARR
jgi:hypothetical protein